jgi:hypothetical protein
MKTVPLILLGASLLSFHSFAGTEGGGGDASEMRVDEIRSDILKWIKNGGAKELEMPEGVSYEEYANKMSSILLPNRVTVSFTNEPVLVNEAEKTCRGYVLQAAPQILCNIPRFEKTPDAGQYKLIHHEFAGLVKLENNIGASSDYVFSSQVTEYLSEERILKLGMKKRSPDANFDKDDKWFCEVSIEENGVTTSNDNYTVETGLAINQPHGSKESGKFDSSSSFLYTSSYETLHFIKKKATISDCLINGICRFRNDLIGQFYYPSPTANTAVEHTSTDGSKTFKTKCLRNKTPKEVPTLGAKKFQCFVELVLPNGKDVVKKEMIVSQDVLEAKTQAGAFTLEAAIVDDQLVMSSSGKGNNETISLKAPYPTKKANSHFNIFKTQNAYNLKYQCSLM